MSRRNKNPPKKAEKKQDHELADLLKKFEFKEDEYLMFHEKCRLESFNNWPFDDESACNPISLSGAGFYHIPTNENPDATRCFLCYKELDGWEPEDNPWSEHKRHSPSCAFLSLKKNIGKLSVDEFLKLDSERQKNKVRKFYHAKIQEWETQATDVRSELMKLNPK